MKRGKVEKRPITLYGGPCDGESFNVDETVCNSGFFRVFPPLEPGDLEEKRLPEPVTYQVHRMYCSKHLCTWTEWHFTKPEVPARLCPICEFVEALGI